MAENAFAASTVAVYDASLLAPALACYILAAAPPRAHGPDATLTQALKSHRKETLSMLLDVAGVGLTLVDARLSLALDVVAAPMWSISDRRIQRIVVEEAPRRSIERDPDQR